MTKGIGKSTSPRPLIDSFEIPRTWMIYVGHFGPDNPLAISAIDPATGNMFHFHKRVEAWKEIAKGYNVINRVGGAPPKGNAQALLALPGLMGGGGAVRSSEGVNNAGLRNSARKNWIGSMARRRHGNLPRLPRCRIPTHARSSGAC